MVLYLFIIFLITSATGLMQSCDKNPAKSKPLHENNRIVFISDRDHHNQVYIMNIDGTSQVRLTNDTKEYFFPKFSPDATRIIFNSGALFVPYGGRTDNDDIYSLNLADTTMVSLTDSPGNDHSPRYSPDGTSIVFVSNRDGNREIYIMNADGTNQTRLTNSSYQEYHPRFSPDGGSIVFFASGPEDFYAIYTIAPDGSNITNLTGESTYSLRSQFFTDYREGSPDIGPVYSPDGSHIYFIADMENGVNIVSMTADGDNHTNLTPFGGFNVGPVLNPSGTKIAFRSFPHIDNDVWVMNTNGSDLTNLTPGTGHVTFMGQYSPAGSKIVYVDLRSGNVYKIFTMDPDGANKIQLTTGHYSDHSPQFEPTTATITQ
jgi:Tol biopolymer transport system component